LLFLVFRPHVRTTNIGAAHPRVIHVDCTFLKKDAHCFIVGLVQRGLYTEMLIVVFDTSLVQLRANACNVTVIQRIVLLSGVLIVR
jgi:hypothetical protein